MQAGAQEAADYCTLASGCQFLFNAFPAGTSWYNEESGSYSTIYTHEFHGAFARCREPGAYVIDPFEPGPHNWGVQFADLAACAIQDTEQTCTGNTGYAWTAYEEAGTNLPCSTGASGYIWMDNAPHEQYCNMENYGLGETLLRRLERGQGPAQFSTAQVAFGTMSDRDTEQAWFDHFTIVGYGPARSHQLCTEPDGCSAGMQRPYTSGAAEPGACEACPAGQYDADSNSASVCVDCQPGQFSAAPLP